MFMFLVGVIFEEVLEVKGFIEVIFRGNSGHCFEPFGFLK